MPPRWTAAGGWLAEREAEIETRHRTGKPGPMAKETRLKVLLDYLEVLEHIQVLDPACGSGAFLVAAFDYLVAEYERVNGAIAELTGSPQQMGLFDLDRQILQDNLFGVDLNRESVEITKLSLWLKTARGDKPLNTLDKNIRCGGCSASGRCSRRCSTSAMRRSSRTPIPSPASSSRGAGLPSLLPSPLRTRSRPP